MWSLIILMLLSTVVARPTEEKSTVVEWCQKITEPGEEPYYKCYPGLKQSPLKILGWHLEGTLKNLINDT